MSDIKESAWEQLADQVQEDLYRQVERPKRSPFQKMRDLVNEIEYSKKVEEVKNVD
jgi:hypothetical protein